MSNVSCELIGFDHVRLRIWFLTTTEEPKYNLITMIWIIVDYETDHFIKVHFSITFDSWICYEGGHSGYLTKNQTYYNVVNALVQWPQKSIFLYSEVFVGAAIWTWIQTRSINNENQLIGIKIPKPESKLFLKSQECFNEHDKKKKPQRKHLRSEITKKINWIFEQKRWRS